jgi:hypothetical protein
MLSAARLSRAAAAVLVLAWPPSSRYVRQAVAHRPSLPQSGAGAIPQLARQHGWCWRGTQALSRAGSRRQAAATWTRLERSSGPQCHASICCGPGGPRARCAALGSERTYPALCCAGVAAHQPCGAGGGVCPGSSQPAAHSPPGCARSARQHVYQERRAGRYAGLGSRHPLLPWHAIAWRRVERRWLLWLVGLGRHPKIPAVPISARGPPSRAAYERVCFPRRRLSHLIVI